MKHVITTLLILASVTNTANANKARILENYGKISLAFTINNEHYDPQVKFSTGSSGFTMFFTSLLEKYYETNFQRMLL